MYTTEEILEKFKKVHGDKYDYSKVEYKKLILPVEIICPIHGSFLQSPHAHLKGQGCPKCGIESRIQKRQDTAETFISKARKIYGDKYDYSKVEYIKSNKKVCIICPKHGEFWTTPNWHLTGRGCPECGKEISSTCKLLSQEEFIKRSNEKHGNKYDYSKVVYKGGKSKVCIICPEHGEFWQTPHEHMNGQGCPECGKKNSAKQRKKTTEAFINKAKKVHGDKYSYEHAFYKGIYEPITITCPKHGDFEQIASYHLSGNGCQKCGITDSIGEEEIFEFVRSILPSQTEIKRRERKILQGQELDIYIPSKNLAIEFDGLYWHCELYKEDINYHLKKTLACEEQGIRLIHIFEDEWINKKEICKSRIMSALGIVENKIPARKCVVQQIESKIAKDFIEKNHIQGYAIGSIINYGLFYNENLVSVMSFSKLRKNLGEVKEENVYELLRFCSKVDFNVIGGASKMFKAFIKEYNPIKVISYCDRRWGNGNVYSKMGFKLDHISRPNYFYIVGSERKNRFCYRKDILISKYGCKKEETEHSFCLKNHWYRIYDCGTKVFCYE